MIKAIQESPMYTRYTLLSEIGGHLGLWVGLSLLAVCEIIEITIGLLVTIFSRIRNNNEDRHNSSDIEDQNIVFRTSRINDQFMLY